MEAEAWAWRGVMHVREHGLTQSSADGARAMRRWQNIWAAGLQPGQLFDVSQSSPQLLQLIQDGALTVPGSRCLVPGCG